MHESDDKPRRLYFETYLKLIRNSVGTGMFRNFYIEDATGKKLDALNDGSNACAFYVSAVLVLVEQLSGVHGTVKSTVDDLRRSGWHEVNEKAMKRGDVVVWEAMEFADGIYQHIGFYIGNDRAVSTSWAKKVVVEHDLHFGGLQRRIERVFRQKRWQ
jgi:hypothetical protein